MGDRGREATTKGPRDALFHGETCRGLLLTSFGFGVLGAKAGQAATAAYTVAALLSLASLFALSRGRKRPDTRTEPTPVLRDRVPSQTQPSHA